MKIAILSSILMVSSVLLIACTPVEDGHLVKPTDHTTNVTMARKMQTDQYFTYGQYSGAVRTEWLGNRKMKLLNTVTFIDPDGVKWEAPKGAIVDGASIPRILWSMLGSPFSGKYRSASVIHDIACDERKRPWKEVHKVFYYAMRASEVSSTKASIMYAAVNNFGPRWGGSRGIGKADDRLSEADYKELVKQIEKREASGNPMSLEEIEKFKKS